MIHGFGISMNLWFFDLYLLTRKCTLHADMLYYCLWGLPMLSINEYVVRMEIVFHYWSSSPMLWNEYSVSMA